jgi:hypothetical protein
MRCNRRLDRFDPLRQLADFILAVDIELKVEVAGGHLVGGSDQLAGWTGDRAGDQEGEQQDDHYRGDGQADQQRARRIGQRLGIGANLVGQLRLEVDERIDILGVFGKGGR